MRGRSRRKTRLFKPGYRRCVGAEMTHTPSCDLPSSEPDRGVASSQQKPLICVAALRLEGRKHAEVFHCVVRCTDRGVRSRRLRERRKRRPPPSWLLWTDPALIHLQDQ